MPRLFTLLLCLGWMAPATLVWGQSHFDLHLDTMSIPDLPGLHSYAFAQHQGKWLLIGGRQDGVHPKFGGFGTAAAHQQICVVDPLLGQVWRRSIAELPDTLQEQLRSANMEFYQHQQHLYFVGGYGRSEVAQNHITYPYLTTINVPGLMDAVLDPSLPLAPHFQQLRDTLFAVAGGQLHMLGDTFFLVGGHRFEGVYSANSGVNQLQFYTNAIRKFTLANGALAHQSIQLDELNLHRRDYNLAPQILANGDPGLVAFSGVFQPGAAALPFQNIVEIDHTGHRSVNGFSQFLANYHCAKVPLYAAADNEMHTLFFGGMSQYWLDANDSLIRDNRIPFVKTVSRVTRLADGSYQEVAFPIELPFYTGTSAEFIPAAGLPTLPNGVIDYDALPAADSTLLGYLVGGIVTPNNQRNPFVANTPNLTSAASLLIKVYLVKTPPSATEGPKPLEGQVDLSLSVFPNPTTDIWHIGLQLPVPGKLRMTLQNAQGRLLRHDDLGRQPAGDFRTQLPTAGLPRGAYWLTFTLDGIFMETKVILAQ